MTDARKEEQTAFPAPFLHYKNLGFPASVSHIWGQGLHQRNGSICHRRNFCAYMCVWLYSSKPGLERRWPSEASLFTVLIQSNRVWADSTGANADSGSVILWWDALYCCLCLDIQVLFEAYIVLGGSGFPIFRWPVWILKNTHHLVIHWSHCTKGKRMNLISGVEHTTCSFFWKLCTLKSQIAKCQRLYKAS